MKIARIILVIAILALPACDKAPKSAGSVAPDFRLDDLTGQTHYLNAELTRPVVLTFFATWCAPCREEIPHLIDVQKRFAGHAQVLCVDVDPENIDKIHSIAKSFQIPYPILLDENKKVMAAYKVRELPVTFVIDTKSRVISRFSTIGETEKASLIETVERILKKP